MYYNLNLFGKKICEIRNNLGYTQKYVCELTTISIDTMRKIENGKVIPNQITLELLSPILKEDLNQLLLNYRLTNYSDFVKLKNRIELKLESGQFEHLEEDLNALNIMISNKNINTYIGKLTKQLYLLVTSIILKTNNNDYDQSLKTLVKAIKITTPNFDLSNYSSFVYNSMEIRILMNIALLFNKLEYKDKVLEILQFCLKAIDSDEIDFKIKILYNLAYNCHRQDLHEKALYYSNLGIDTCIGNNSLNCLALLYSRKGIAEYHLGLDNYKESLLNAITVFNITNQKKLTNILIESCKKNYNISI